MLIFILTFLISLFILGWSTFSDEKIFWSIMISSAAFGVTVLMSICIPPFFTINTQETYQIEPFPSGNYIVENKVILKDSKFLNLHSKIFAWADSDRKELIVNKTKRTIKSWLFTFPLQVAENTYEFYVPLTGATVGLT